MRYPYHYQTTTTAPRAFLSRLITSMALVVAGMSPLEAQEIRNEEPEGWDSTDVYDLGSVIVLGDSADTRSPIRTERVSLYQLRLTDPSSISDVVYQVPSMRAQTNSRGESILYIRNAGERQVGIFFDGALLNIPWDNRLDLSMVPMNAVGGIAVQPAAPGIRFGANVSGGAVNMETRDLVEEGNLTDADVRIGELSSGGASVTHLGRKGNVSYIASASWLQKDGTSLPASAELPFNQSDPAVRTNSYQRSFGFYTRGELRPTSADRISVSFNLVDSRKGVPPEGHEEDARFWQYPLWRNVMVNGSYLHRGEAHDPFQFTTSVWLGRFQQQIDQFASADYDTLTDIEHDNDLTFGMRSVLSKQFNQQKLSLAVNALRSIHRQTDSEVDPDGTESPGPQQDYGQITFSAGPEYHLENDRAISLTAGLAFDGMITTSAGDKERLDPFFLPNVVVGGVYAFNNSFSIGVVAGYKGRFPSLRELYGEALRRFLINPDLKPEVTASVELNGDYSWSSGSIRGALFLHSTDNTIDQRRVDTLGSSLRQRINLDGSRTVGVELGGQLRPLSWLDLRGHVTLMYSRAATVQNGATTYEEYLSEKPDMLATVDAQVELPANFRLLAEVRGVGTAYSPAGQGEYIQLPAGVELNGRVSWRMENLVASLSFLELFLRVDNVFDQTLYYQPGLPERGRTLSGGARLTF